MRLSCQLVYRHFVLKVIARIDEADLQRVETSLAEEETILATLTERKTTSEHRLAMTKRDLTQRSRETEKLKLVSRRENQLRLKILCYDIDQKIGRELVGGFRIGSSNAVLATSTVDRNQGPY